MRRRRFGGAVRLRQGLGISAAESGSRRRRSSDVAEVWWRGRGEGLEVQWRRGAGA